MHYVGDMLVQYRWPSDARKVIEADFVGKITGDCGDRHTRASESYQEFKVHKLNLKWGNARSDYDWTRVDTHGRRCVLENTGPEKEPWQLAPHDWPCNRGKTF